MIVDFIDILKQLKKDRIISDYTVNYDNINLGKIDFYVIPIKTIEKIELTCCVDKNGVYFKEIDNV